MTKINSNRHAGKVAEKTNSNFNIFKSQMGFTLLEILVSLMILTIGLASVFGLFGAGARSYRRSIDDITASEMAQTIFTELNNRENLNLENQSNQTHPNFPAIYKYDLMFQEISDLPDRVILVVLRIKKNEGLGGGEEFQMLLKPRTKTP
ncbi:MAG: prepilin-type N-terminal cleavage/methylation domain-containing protein [Planctomycetota bacterium]